MARRTFDVIDVAEILVHWHAGRSLNEMAGSLGVDRKTLFVTAGKSIYMIPLSVSGSLLTGAKP